jgi:hypothetical protein
MQTKKGLMIVIDSVLNESLKANVTLPKLIRVFCHPFGGHRLDEHP